MALAGIWNLGTPKVSVLYDFTIFFTYMNSDLSLYNLKCSIWIYHHKIINEFKKYEFMKNIVKLQTWNYVPSWQWSASSPAGLSPTVALRPLAGTGLSGTVCFSFAGAAVPNRAAGPNLIFCFLKSRSCRRHQRTGLCKLLCKRCAAWFCLNFMDFTWTDFTWIKPDFDWISWIYLNRFYLNKASLSLNLLKFHGFYLNRFYWNKAWICLNLTSCSWLSY